MEEPRTEGETTPGPWEICTSPEGDLWIEGPGEYVVCDLMPDFQDQSEDRANAELIASAPGLSARLRASEQALRDLLYVVDRGWHTQSAFEARVVAAARSALVPQGEGQEK